MMFGILMLISPLFILLLIAIKLEETKFSEFLSKYFFQIMLEEWVTYFFVLIFFYLIIVIPLIFTIKPNEVISSFIKNSNALISIFNENTNTEEKYKAIKLLDYCIDFLPHSAGFYVLPVGMRLGYDNTSTSRIHQSIRHTLSQKMESLKKQLEKLAFNIRYAKTPEEFRAISTELENLSEIMENERYESLEELDYEPYSLYKRFSIFLDTSKLPGALILFILYALLQLLSRLDLF